MSEHLINRETAAHWYSKLGQPMHQVMSSSNELRNTTLRDARKLGLYPSVSTILKVVAKPGLEIWKQEQAIVSALTLPMHQGEPLHEFSRRVVSDMGEQSKKAMEWGTTIHNAIENFMNGVTISSETLLPWMEHWIDYAKENSICPIQAEGTVVHPKGFAGRYDLYALYRGEPCIIDFKTQSCLSGNKLKFYDEWELQLAAYQQALLESGKPVAGIISVVINATTSEPFIDQVWGNSSEAWQAFLAAFTLWKFQNHYDPCAPIYPTTSKK